MAGEGRDVGRIKAIPISIRNIFVRKYELSRYKSSSARIFARTKSRASDERSGRGRKKKKGEKGEEEIEKRDEWDGSRLDRWNDDPFPLKRISTALFSRWSRAG